MSAPPMDAYPARLEIDYPDTLNRLTTLLRLILAIPLVALLAIMTGSNELIVAPTALLILIRRKYPRWWFEFNLEYTRFASRIGAYLMLLTDRYPSTDEEQSVHIELDYPDATADLNRFLPIVKWMLAMPHYIVLSLLMFLLMFVEVAAWPAILITGRYPRPLFDFVVGVQRWGLRVSAYAFLMVTDRYPPFRLSA